MKLRLEHILFVLAFGIATTPAIAATRNWIGGSGVWSNPNNWRDVPDELPGVPQDGDTLLFDDGGDPDFMTNDLVNFAVGSLRFGQDDLSEELYRLTGNPLHILDGITATAPETRVEIECPLILEGEVFFHAVAPMGLNAEAQLRIKGGMELTGRLVLRGHYAGQIDLTGAIVGTGDIFLPLYVRVEDYPAGRVKIDGTADNTFAGSIILENDRRLELDKQSGVAVPGALFIGTNCQVNLKRPHQIADASKVAIAAGGRLLLEGHTENIGSLCLTNYAGDTLSALVSTDGSTLSVREGVTAENASPSVTPFVGGKLGLAAGSHVIHTVGSATHALNIQSLVSGDGGITKTGGAGLILGGNNSFAGDAVIQEDRVDVNHANALGAPSGAAILDGGELYVNGVPVGNKTLIAERSTIRVPEVNALLNVVGVSSWAGPIILNTNLTVAGGNMTLSAAISGAGGLRFLFNDRAQLAGSEANTYTGDTWADGGLLELNKASGVTAFRGRLIVNAGSGAPDEVRWLQDFQCIGADVTLFPGALVNLNNRRDEFGPVTFNAGTIATGTGEIGIYGLVTVNPSIDSAFITGRLGLPGGIREYRVSDGSPFPDLRIDATIVGPGGLRKTGIGQMWLAAANTYGGLTIVAEGALSVLDPNGLGAPATGTTVNEGGTLEVNFIGSMPEPLAIRGAGLAGQGSLGVFGNVTLRTPFPSIYAAIDLTTHAAIGVAPDSQLTVDGTVSGIGNLTKAGPGTLWFGGNDHNTYSGETFINEGRFIMGKPSGATAVPGPLNIGSPAGLSALAGNVASYQVIGNIFVNRGGLLNLNGQAENVDHLWLSEGGDVQTTTGVLFLKSGGSIQVVPGAVGDPATISGNLDMDAGAHVINVGASTALSGPNLEITALISSSVGAITLQKNGPGTLRFAANNTYSGTTIVNEGVLRVDGWQQQGAVRVNAAGTLQGVGVVGNITFSGNGGVVAPGASPGVLGCNSFSFGSSGGGILEIELNGASPGSGHDQLTVGGIGQIDLSGITLRAKPGFIAATNQQFVIINNFGNPAVQGAFNGLPENASLTLGDQLFRISYIGGDGNDVMLTKIGDVFRPRLWIERIAPASVRLLWPTNDLVFTLQFTTNSSGTNFTGWSVVPEAPVLSGTNRVVTNSSSGAHKLYRLLKP